MIYHIISYHIISYHIISYRIVSYRIISYHIISYHIISYHQYNIDIEDQFEASTFSHIPMPDSSFFCVFAVHKMIGFNALQQLILWNLRAFGHRWNDWRSSTERIPNRENQHWSELTIGWWITHLDFQHPTIRSAFFFARPLWYGIDPYLWQLWMNSCGILSSCRDRQSTRIFQSKMYKTWKLCWSQMSLVAAWADLLYYLTASICFYEKDCAFHGKNFGSGNSHGDFHHGVLLQPGFEKIAKKDLGFL